MTLFVNKPQQKQALYWTVTKQNILHAPLTREKLFETQGHIFTSGRLRRVNHSARGKFKLARRPASPSLNKSRSWHYSSSLCVTVLLSQWPPQRCYHSWILKSSGLFQGSDRILHHLNAKAEQAYPSETSTNSLQNNELLMVSNAKAGHKMPAARDAYLILQKLGILLILISL